MGKRMVVVGGVAGGASAAAKAKRENPELEVVVYEKSGWVSYGACGLPYVLSGEIPRLERLVARTPEEFRKQGVLVRTRHEVVDVDYELRTLTVHDHAEGRTFQDRFDHLVLATGARPSLPPIPGTEQEGVYTLRTMEDGERLLLERAREALMEAAPLATTERLTQPLEKGPVAGRSVQEVLRDPDPEILRAFFQAVLENPERLAETDVVNAFVNWLLEP